MDRSREIKARLERLLRLESAPEFLDIVNHRVEHDFADFHRRRPLRGVVLDETFRHYWRLSDDFRDGRLVERVRWHLYAERQALRALATARTLMYHAWTVGVEEYSVSMDGHLEIEGCAQHLTLDLLSLGAIEQEARIAWERRDSVSTYTGIGGRLGAQTVLLPDAALTEQRCAEAVRRWYRARFQWTRGHWTHEERSEPTFAFDWEWQVLPPTEDEEEEAARRHWLGFSNLIRTGPEVEGPPLLRAVSG